MTTYNTGLPVPSADARDRYDNSQTFDQVINGTLTYYPNRVGANVLSLRGMQQLFEIDQANRVEQFNTFIENSGYEIPVPYAAGILVERYSQLIEYSGELYRAKPGMMPFTTTGTWATDSLKLVSVGDAALRQELASPGGAGMLGLLSALPDAVPDTVEAWINRWLPDLETFGGKGDYTTVNDVALAKLIASGAKGMRLNQGIYRFPDGQSFPTGFIITGVGAPNLGHGTMDDKQWLRTGYKHLMPGSSMIFSGTGTATFPCPQRIDEFATVRPCVRIYQGGLGAVATKWSGFAIIQDMECRTADGSRFTLPSEDNRSDYEVGLLIDDVSQLQRTDVVIFGYFPKAGTAISSVLGNDDPDYNQMIGGSTMGKYGLALLGSNNGPATHGLSGTHAFGHALYTLDHHSRGEMTLPELTAAYANADTWSVLYADGDIDASSAEINGHEFHACSFRSNANHAIRHDHISNLKVFGGIYEFRSYGVPNSTTPTFLATANAKRGIEYHSMRNNFPDTIFNPNYIGIMPVKVIVTGDPLNGRLGVFGKDPGGVYSGVILGSDGNIGDCAVQWTKNVNDGGSGWRQFMDVSAADTLVTSYEGANLNSMTTDGVRVPAGGERRLLAEVGPALTIASDTITVTRSVHAVVPESGTADNISQINGGVAGMFLTIRPSSSSHVITIVRTVGNIRLDASANKVLNGSLSSIRLYYNGSFWIQDGSVMTNG